MNINAITIAWKPITLSYPLINYFSSKFVHGLIKLELNTSVCCRAQERVLENQFMPKMRAICNALYC